MVIGIAAPTAWGLYSTGEKAPAPHPAPYPADTSYRDKVGRDWPLMRELQQVNDWGVYWKNRLNAYLKRENTAARVANLRSCYPAIGGGLVAKHTTLRPDGPGDVVGEIVNTTGETVPRAKISVRLYDGAGKLVGQTWTEVKNLKYGVPRGFRAMVSRFPLHRVREVMVSAVVTRVPDRNVPLLKVPGQTAPGCGHAATHSEWSPATSSGRP